MKVRVGKARLLRVCGDSNKESLKHAHFFIDYNVTDAVFNKSVDYVPGPNRVPIPHRRYVGDECTEMRHLEEGKHVLTMQTNTKEPRHWTSFSHVIEFA